MSPGIIYHWGHENYKQQEPETVSHIHSQEEAEKMSAWKYNIQMTLSNLK